MSFNSLLDDGYDVTGATLRLFDSPEVERQISDAASVCQKLGIKHTVINLSCDFKKKVMDKFAESYLMGETPNPCIECNKHIKFGKMLDIAEDMGFDCIATGHYAVRDFDEKTGKYNLKRAKDPLKDQSYVLYSLTQYQLSKTLLPLGDREKTEIRKIAENAGFINSQKPDSQDICFVPDGDYASFIKRHTGAEITEGNFLDTAGNIIGRHKGVINYTIGQRRGIGISLGKQVYVIDKNAADNTVTLGDECNLYKPEIFVGKVNLISIERLPAEMRVCVKVRYSKNEQSAVITPADDGVLVKFDTPQRAPAKGQAAVFYENDTVIGGGTIK